MSRLLEADKTLSAIVAVHLAGPSTPFMEAYNAGVGLPPGSKKKAEVLQQGDIADDKWPVSSFHHPGSRATDEEAFGLGVITKHGIGDGTGLSLGGGLEVVLCLLESETDLTVGDLVAAPRAEAAAIAHENAKRHGTDVGVTSGRDMSLNSFGGAQAIATAAGSAGISPDELVNAHATVMTASMHCGRRGRRMPLNNCWMHSKPRLARILI